MVIVHLPGVGDDGDVMRLAQIGDLFRRSNAADPVDVKLRDVKGPKGQRLTEPGQRIFMLAPEIVTSPIAFNSA